MLLILVPKETNRLRYTLQLILVNLLGLEIELTCNIADYQQYDGQKFSYGVKIDEVSLFFSLNVLIVCTISPVAFL